MDIAGQLFRIKEFIIAGVTSLPIILGGISLLLACSTANTGFAILTLCLGLIVPFITFVLNKISPIFKKIIGLLPSQFIGEGPLFAEQAAAICKIAPWNFAWNLQTKC